jgi:diguanylate cyclase
VLLPDTPLEGAERVAEALREGLTNLGVVWKGEPISLTASFGVAAAQPGEVDAQAVIARADTALYLAKEQGRNCVRSEAESAAA